MCVQIHLASRANAIASSLTQRNHTIFKLQIGRQQGLRIDPQKFFRSENSHQIDKFFREGWVQPKKITVLLAKEKHLKFDRRICASEKPKKIRRITGKFFSCKYSKDRN